MSEDLDIIPILVVSDSQNKAEMLNGLLRGEGLAVRPLWTDTTEGWESLPTAPELVFYFTDTGDPDLKSVVRAADAIAAPVVAIAAGDASLQAADALSTGAAAWVPTEDAPLLAATVRRERRYHVALARLQTAEREVENGRRRLESLVASSQDCLAYVQEGVVVETNPAWAERLEYPDADALTGLPVMDLFAGESHETLKQVLKAATKGRGTREPVALVARSAAGKDISLDVEIAAVDVDGERQLQLRVKGEDEAEGPSGELGLRLDELESENRRLSEAVRASRQSEPGTRLLNPPIFAPAAAERIARPLAGTVRALVVVRPADQDETVSRFDPLEIAEAGTGIGPTVSPLLEDEDIATRIDDLTLVALINRPDQGAIEEWTQAVVQALGEHIFEASNRSSRIGFAAGYAPVDRVRRLDVLTRQALQAAAGRAGTVSHAESGGGAGAEAQDADWEAMIQEAIAERRFAVAMRPIEDLSRGEKFFEATPRLVDREGREIPPQSFMGPAERLGFIKAIQQRLLGHAFMALLRLLREGDAARVIVPLGPAAMEDDKLAALLVALVKRTEARLPVKSLVLELSLDDAGTRIKAAQEFSGVAARLNCGLGLRDYKPGDAADRLMEHISLDTLRLAPDVVEKLGEDEDLAGRVRELSAAMSEDNCRVIASGVSDANMMALLYNLGISTVEGPAIGDAELFSPSESESPLFAELQYS